MAIRTLTARQSKQARSLLKWNLHDLSSRTNIPSKHLERFERSLTRLTLPEVQECIKIYEKNGIRFLDNLDVILAKQEADDRDQNFSNLTEIKTIEAEEEGADITFAKASEDKKDDGLWVHTPDYTGPDRRNAGNQRHFTGTERRKDRQNMVQRVIDKYKDKK